MGTQPFSPKRERNPLPNFRFISIVTKRLDASKCDLVWPTGLCVRWGPSPSPPQKKTGRNPQFSAYVYCGHTAAWIKMPLGTEVGLGPDDIALDGDPAPPKRGRNPSPIFGPSIVAKRLDGSRWHLAWRWVLVRATLCWMGTQLPSPKTGHSPQFSAHFYCVQTAGCMKLPLRMEVCLSSGDFVLGGVPAPAKGAQQPPSFGPMSIVATVAHLSYC